MNILFGNQDIETIRQQARFTVLELDTIQAGPDHQPQTAYCLLSDIPLDEIGELEHKVSLHHDMIHHYRTGQWTECRGLLTRLSGSWNGEVDSFYDEILRRLDETDLSSTLDWDGIYRPWRR